MICVDNGSTDGSAEAIAESFGDVELIALERNLGFAGGMNVGIRAALTRDAAYVLTLNNDTIVERGFAEPLVAALQSDPEAAAACSQILFADEAARSGTRSTLAFTPWYQGRQLRYGERPLPPETKAYRTDRACAGAMLAPRGALEHVGLFDESLFAYAEDVDWSLRGREHGYHSSLSLRASCAIVSAPRTGGEASATTLYYSLRNGLAVAERHAPLGGVGTGLRRLEALAAHAAQAALYSPRRREAFRALVDGWRDLRRGRFGARHG